MESGEINRMNNQYVKQPNNQIEGCIDLHVHCAPDPFWKRKCTAREIAEQAAQTGMRGVVLKSHDYLTTPMCYSLNEIHAGAELFGSLTLNWSVGGLNPQAVLVAAKLETRVIWLPTFDSTTTKVVRKLPSISIINENGSLMTEMETILEIIKEHDMVLCTGHVSEAEVFAVTDRAIKMDIKTVITHPFTIAEHQLSLEQQRKLVKMGAYIEHCFSPCLRNEGGFSPIRIVEAVKALGAEHCVLSTDFGQYYNPPPVEGMAMMVTVLKKNGLSGRELELTTKTNPAWLLGLHNS